MSQLRGWHMSEVIAVRFAVVLEPLHTHESRAKRHEIHILLQKKVIMLENIL